MGGRDGRADPDAELCTHPDRSWNCPIAHSAWSAASIPMSRLKPRVMLYAPDIPREQALIVDLSQEGSLSIVKNLRPGEVSKEVRDYLNPRRIISYFTSRTLANLPHPMRVERSTQSQDSVSFGFKSV